MWWFTFKHTYWYGLARTLVALSLFTTLVFDCHSHVFYLVESRNIPYDFWRHLNFFFLFGESHLFAAHIVACMILLLVMSGYLPQITGVLHWWVAFSFFHAATLIEGGDQIASIITFLLIPITVLDKRINHWQRSEKPISEMAQNICSFFYSLIVIQISALYFHAFIGKLNVSEWTEGTAVYYWFTHNSFGLNGGLKNLILPILLNKYFLLLMTWGSLAIEFLLAVAIFLPPKNKNRLLVVGFLFHIAIWIFHGLGNFMFSMLGCLLLYLPSKDFLIKKN